MFKLLSRYVICVGFAATFAGCGVASTPTTSATLGRPPAVKVEGSDGDLLYASHSCGGLCVFSYPRLKPVGSVTIPSGTAGYLCSDTQGNVFVLPASSNGGTIYEYAHGGTTPIATLSDGASYGGVPRGCSVDPTTENLAVTNNGSSNGSNIAIYVGGSGAPIVYQGGAKLANIGGCGYDDNGNLYIAGEDSGKHFSLAELENGSNSLSYLAGPQPSSFGHIQWVGGQMYMEDPGKDPQIYHISIDGSKFKFVGTTTFQGPKRLGQAWIYKRKIVAPFSTRGAKYSHIGLWRFPAGGTSIKRRANLGYIQGVTVSVAP
jgi:hypothetical protein